ncbi:MAG: hypothetical protein M3Y80_01935 [Verrucomicrobiota bacterium]|nr:hypothetical protein [Verrucomicrobiota bacterium]
MNQDQQPFSRPAPVDPANIKGWGIDIDQKNDPTYPMKKRNNGEQKGYTWQRPTQQPIDVEVLHSIERPNVTAVFGTVTPPSGLSGMIRRLAFKKSESSYGHWLPLALADRVNEVEGIVHDLAHAKIPNIPGELGWAAEWKYNRASLLTRVLIGAVVVSALGAYIAAGDDDD